MGFALHRQGKLDEAIASYLKAMALDPDNPATHHIRGEAPKEQGKEEEAEKHLARARELKRK